MKKKMVNKFKTLLCYLGEFRNMLVHNQPIYCYNVLNYNINGKTKFEYELPLTKSELKDLMKLSGYNSNEIEAKTNISYNTMAIIPDNAPVIVLDDLVKQLENGLFIKQVLKELLENNNLEELKVVSELSDKIKKEC